MSDTTKQNNLIVTVSIVNFNTAHLLEQCVASIEKYVPHLRHIVIINHSCEKITLPKVSAPLMIITQKNIGFGAGHNRAVAEIQNIVKVERLSEHIHLIFNPDAFLTQDITPLLTHFNDKRVAVVGPQLIDSTSIKDPHCMGSQPTFARTILRKFHYNTTPTIPTATDWVSGASMLIRVGDFLEAKGFDDQYFLYFEDTDFCTRLKNHHDKKIIFDPTVNITHDSGQSFPSTAAQKKHYDASQDIYFCTHHNSLHATTQKLFRSIWRKVS